MITRRGFIAAAAAGVASTSRRAQSQVVGKLNARSFTRDCLEFCVGCIIIDVHAHHS